MLKYMLLIVCVFLIPIAPSYAQDGTDCQQLADNVWMCPLPTKPAPPPTCHVFGDNLVCDAPIAAPAVPERKAPTNCGWRKGRYICW